jgi:hypothetical protein
LEKDELIMEADRAGIVVVAVSEKMLEEKVKGMS